MEATTTAVVIQNSVLTDAFLITGQAFWAIITLIGIVTVANKAFRGFVPKKK